MGAVMSFGYRYGVPAAPGLVVFDARGIPDPIQDRRLKARSGLDPVVQSAVLTAPGAAALIDRIVVVARDRDVAVGCSSGRHRAPAIAAEVARVLGVPATHRDLERSKKP